MSARILIIALAFPTVSVMLSCGAASNEQRGAIFDGNSFGSASIEEPIINGDEVTPEENATVGVVLVSPYPQYPDPNWAAQANCTGVLLTNTVVLTARHCVESTGLLEDNLDGSWITYPNLLIITSGTLMEIHEYDRFVIFEDSSTSPTYQQSKILEVIVTTGNTMADDLALLIVETPFSIGGSTAGYVRSVSSMETSEGVGQSMTCYGYGRNSYTSGFGTLRKGQMTISFHDPLNVYHERDGLDGPIIWKGDSGGPCFINNEIVHIGSFGYEDLEYPGFYVYAAGVSPTSIREFLNAHKDRFGPNDFPFFYDTSFIVPVTAMIP